MFQNTNTGRTPISIIQECCFISSPTVGFSLTCSGVCVKEYYCGLNLYACLRLSFFLKAEPKKITYVQDAIQGSKNEGSLGVIEK